LYQSKLDDQSRKQWVCKDMIFGGGQLRAWQHVMVMENKIKIVFCLIRVYFLKLSLLEASEVPALEPLASASPFTTDEFVDRLVAPRLPLDESSSSTEVGVEAEVRPDKITSHKF